MLSAQAVDVVPWARMKLITALVMGGTISYRATITVDIDGRHVTETYVSDKGGPIHAAVQAVNRIVRPNDLVLISSCTKSRGVGSDAIALATMVVRSAEGKCFTGRGQHVDTIVACMEAYIDALRGYFAPAT